MDEKVPSFFRFEDLRVYTKAVDYSKWLIRTLRDADTESESNICRTFVNSAMDISLNIVEGSTRSKSQFDHYLKIAKSAIRECVIYTTVANGVEMLNDEESEQSREYLMELTRMIGALIISLQRSTRKPREFNPALSPMQDDVESDNDFDSDFGDIEG